MSVLSIIQRKALGAIQHSALASVHRKALGTIRRAALLLLTAFLSMAAVADPIWIDVRSSEEFNQGHLPGALNIVHTDIASKIAAVTTDKNAEIKLYCRSGRRSGLALEALQKLGYSNVENAGSYAELAASQAKPQQ